MPPGPRKLGPGPCTGARARGRGYAVEAAAALAEWALSHDAPRVHLFTDVANTASQRVAERAGFRREGVVRRCLDQRDGAWTDAVLFGRVRAG
ncbi:GNAT family N-acetyltransferase [Geodermatophilus sp. TF02-6]|uniref:GNAT family N-acetyltransferase n=1 Tax=Geodermatophilus sp. TF02-6 TaxID=2250575 RepID=UPI0018F49A71|nr:GNAT family protein [Geodermatophilus sp. TF02-6]